MNERPRLSPDEFARALAAVLSADNPQGYENNIADGLFAIAKAIDGVSGSLDAIATMVGTLDSQEHK